MTRKCFHIFTLFMTMLKAEKSIAWNESFLNFCRRRKVVPGKLWHETMYEVEVI